jgi:hypothetical protein
LNRDKTLNMSAKIIPFDSIKTEQRGKDMSSVPAKRDNPQDGIDLNRLKDPFSENEVEFRLSQCGETNSGIWGQCLAYITSRAIMDRLDDVCGPSNWKVSYEFVGETGVVCNLSILVNGEWITKQDGAEQTNIESFKGGISSALKRAGSAWGMGRYLYSLDATFITIVDKSHPGAQFGKTRNGVPFYWIPPKLPSWALPKSAAQTKTPTVPENKPEEHPKTNSLSLGQLNRLYAIATSKGLNRQTTDAIIRNEYGCSAAEMSYQDYRYFTDQYLPQRRMAK